MMQSNRPRLSLSEGVTEILLAGRDLYAQKIVSNEERLSGALDSTGEVLGLGEATELILRNQAIQKQIEEVEELLNRPISRGV